MNKVLSIISVSVGVLFGSLAAATGLSDKTTLMITDAGLSMFVGWGTVSGGEMELELIDAPGTAVTLVFATPEGEVIELAGVIQDDGSLQVQDGEQVLDFGAWLEAANVSLTQREAPAQAEENDDEQLERLKEAEAPGVSGSSDVVASPQTLTDPNTDPAVSADEPNANKPNANEPSTASELGVGGTAPPTESAPATDDGATGAPDSSGGAADDGSAPPDAGEEVPPPEETDPGETPPDSGEEVPPPDAGEEAPPPEETDPGETPPPDDGGGDSATPPDAPPDDGESSPPPAEGGGEETSPPDDSGGDAGGEGEAAPEDPGDGSDDGGGSGEESDSPTDGSEDGEPDDGSGGGSDDGSGDEDGGTGSS